QWFLERGNAEDWFESRLITSLAIISVVSGALFIWWELKTPHPAVNLRVLKHRSLAAGSMFSALLGMGLYGTIFAVPIFAQQVLHFTSMQVGILLIPGALAAGFNMPIMGRLIGRVDTRILITCGAIVTSLVMFSLARINTTMGQEALFWPLLFRGVGISMMFLPLSVATIGPVPRKDIGSASGFYNLTRQLGGSIGIAILTTLISQRAAYHFARLTDHVTLYSQATQHRLSAITNGLVASGSDLSTAKAQALQIVSGLLHVQAYTLSFADAFRIGGVAFFLVLPLVFFLGRGIIKRQAPDTL
ncbi:MAG TPA: MFS transporter, partial [Fimbriimonadaceae bacterium]|nr:MFS transporter [Fimbriimonadaceae bacterium]